MTPHEFNEFMGRACVVALFCVPLTKLAFVSRARWQELGKGFEDTMDRLTSLLAVD
jgi:hypothetical protein